MTVTIERFETRDEWLTARRKSLGGSDAAVVAGVSKRASEYALWADKTGLVVDDSLDGVEFVGALLSPELHHASRDPLLSGE